MTLHNGTPGGQYLVSTMALPLGLARRLQALGMTPGSQVQILRKKRKGALIVKVRGSRFALGQAISSHIMVEGGGGNGR